MARVTHTVRTIRSADPDDLSSLGTTLTVPFVAADTTNKEQALFTGKEIIVALNSGASPYTVTVDGVKTKGRAGSVTAYSIPAGEVMMFAPPIDGWRQTNGMLYFEANNVAVKFAVIKYQ
jgi:hypothetical protein